MRDIVFKHRLSDVKANTEIPECLTGLRLHPNVYSVSSSQPLAVKIRSPRTSCEKDPGDEPSSIPVVSYRHPGERGGHPQGTIEKLSGRP